MKEGGKSLASVWVNSRTMGLDQMPFLEGSFLGGSSAIAAEMAS